VNPRILLLPLVLALWPAPIPAQDFDPAVFNRTLPPAEMAFLAAYDGAAPKQLEHDKKFGKLIGAVSPNGMFHLGVDMPIQDALELVLQNATTPVRLRDGRYLMV